ncbi:unnamed protein product [Sphacelaria rigidula]
MPRKSCRSTASTANPTITKTELLRDPLSTVYPSKRRG